LIGIIYVGSGLVVTLLGRQQWKTRRSRRSLPKKGEVINREANQDDGHDDPGGPKG